MSTINIAWIIVASISGFIAWRYVERKSTEYIERAPQAFAWSPRSEGGGGGGDGLLDYSSGGGHGGDGGGHGGGDGGGGDGGGGH